MYEVNLKCSKCRRNLLKGNYSLNLIEVRCSCGATTKLNTDTRKEDHKDYLLKRRERIDFTKKKMRERYDDKSINRR